MSEVTPAIAAVRPRISRRGVFQHRLLEDIIAERLEENPRGVLRFEGADGSGKTAALRHLAAVFAHDDRLQFLDEPHPKQFASRRHDKLLVVTFPSGSPLTTKLDSWSIDELVEYLLAKHRAECGSVMARLGAAARRPWSPQLAAIVLDRFAANSEATDPAVELIAHLRQLLSNPEHHASIGRFCLTIFTGSRIDLEIAGLEFTRNDCPRDAVLLLRHSMVQTPVAAEHLFGSLCSGSSEGLRRTLPFDLIECVASLCRQNETAIKSLNASLNLKAGHIQQAMAASILFAADAAWRPPKNRRRWRLACGFFRHANWPGIELTRDDLSNADFSGANLEGANLEYANVSGADFTGATLNGARLERLHANKTNFISAKLTEAKLSKSNLTEANFTNADLTDASLVAATMIACDLTSASLVRAILTNAQLYKAVLDGTDLTGAVLREANLSSVDLRTAILNGAILESANLDLAQLEDVDWPNVKLIGVKLRAAHLTGSKLTYADLRNADLSNSFLAGINWQGADLRGANLKGATFHMGSSRSGLVGSPIACEGSKTGFYTDDFEDRHFKYPEEIRKASLQGADLRGANLASLDLYLVDLRDAKLDRSQIEHARRCGAILEDASA